VLDFYNARRRNLATATPNPAHHALARLGRELQARGGALFLCTQNIDDLHEQAGSDGVLHMHGELFKIRCTGCGAVIGWRDDVLPETACPACGAAGRLRPQVVWFGELPLEMDRIYRELLACDLFVSIGTSGSVYPAAGFVAEAHAAGARTCELNLEPSENAHAFDERRLGPASEVVPAWVHDLLGGLHLR
jgi:NAD-dependent deacetylase